MSLDYGEDLKRARVEAEVNAVLTQERIRIIAVLKEIEEIPGYAPADGLASAQHHAEELRNGLESGDLRAYEVEHNPDCCCTSAWKVDKRCEVHATAAHNEAHAPDFLTERERREVLEVKVRFLEGLCDAFKLQVAGLEKDVAVAESFHKVAVQERDLERHNVERWQKAYHDLLSEVTRITALVRDITPETKP